MQVPQNIKDGLYVVLQQKLLPAKLNQQSNQNLRLLLGWADDEGLFQIPTATAEEIANFVLSHVRQQAAALLWDIQPNFDAPAPKQLTKREADAELQRRQLESQARELKQRNQEQAENSEAAFWERQKQAEANKKVEGEKLAEEVAARDLYATIMNFSVNRGPHSVDHARSDEIRKYLLGIAVNSDGKKHNRETLRFVNELISRLDNDATVGKARAIVEDLNRERQRIAEKKPRRDSFGVL